MAPFPYLPMTAVMASLLSMQIAELTLFSYVGYMLEHLGVVDDKDEAGETLVLLCLLFRESPGFVRSEASNWVGIDVFCFRSVYPVRCAYDLIYFEV